MHWRSKLRKICISIVFYVKLITTISPNRKINLNTRCMFWQLNRITLPLSVFTKIVGLHFNFNISSAATFSNASLKTDLHSVNCKKAIENQTNTFFQFFTSWVLNSLLGCSIHPLPFFDWLIDLKELYCRIHWLLRVFKEKTEHNKKIICIVTKHSFASWWLDHLITPPTIFCLASWFWRLP